MARPVKWSRDLYPIRERAAQSRIETWSRQDIEQLFHVGRATAQTLMKAIGDVQNVGGAHFVDHASLLTFLTDVIAADSVEEGLNARLLSAAPPPSVKPLRVSLPSDLRLVMVCHLPVNIRLTTGRLEIDAVSAVSMLESLVLLAQAMQNDLTHFEQVINPPSLESCLVDDELNRMFTRLRQAKKVVPLISCSV
jgi:hypothetical protein